MTTIAFETKMNLCLRRSENAWITDDVISHIPVVEIAQKFLDISGFDGNLRSSGPESLFAAFVIFKNNGTIPFYNASYLRTRSGILGFTTIFAPQYARLEFTVPELIRFLDGDNFFAWLEILAVADIGTVETENAIESGDITESEIEAEDNSFE